MATVLAAFGLVRLWVWRPDDWAWHTIAAAITGVCIAGGAAVAPVDSTNSAPPPPISDSLSVSHRPRETPLVIGALLQVRLLAPLAAAAMLAVSIEVLLPVSLLVAAFFWQEP